MLMFPTYLRLLTRWLHKLSGRYTYYWYNFMPLARGTAAVGYTTILSLFLSAGMPITAHIPKNYQTDWEAILSQSPLDFTAALGPWLYPPQARGEPRAPEQVGYQTANCELRQQNLVAVRTETRE